MRSNIRPLTSRGILAKGGTPVSGSKFQGEAAMARCVPMSRLQGVLSGKWKILILWYVAFYKVQRRLSSPGGLPGGSAKGGVQPHAHGGELHSGAALYAGLERSQSLPARLCQSL